MILDRHPDRPGEPRWAGVKFVGYWRMDADHVDPRGKYAEFLRSLPDPHDHVDLSWDPDERARVLDLLKVATAFTRWKGFSRCRICGDLNGTTCDTFDGSWVWPAGLAHYVEEHRVRLPQAFVDHALGLPADLVAELRRHAATLEDIVATYEREKDPALCPVRGVACNASGTYACTVSSDGGRFTKHSYDCNAAGDRRYEAYKAEEALHEASMKKFMREVQEEGGSA